MPAAKKPAAKERQALTPEEKLAHQIKSEHKRKDNISSGLKMIASMVPSLTQNNKKNNKRTTVNTISQYLDYASKLKHELADLELRMSGGDAQFLAQYYGSMGLGDKNEDEPTDAMLNTTKVYSSRKNQQASASTNQNGSTSNVPASCEMIIASASTNQSGSTSNVPASREMIIASGTAIPDNRPVEERVVHDLGSWNLNERSKWGILEKHKDYSLRARDFNAKKERLKLLRQKVAAKNPDEFHYGMLSSSGKSKNGTRLADRGNPVLSHTAVKLLKTQDQGYLQTMIQQNRKARERLEHEIIVKDGKGGNRASGVQLLGSIDESQKSTHIRLIDDEDKDYLQPDVWENGLGAHFSDGQRTKNRTARLRKLAALKVREKDMVDAEHDLGLQRAKMSNCVGGMNKDGTKWKMRERKR